MIDVDIKLRRNDFSIDAGFKTSSDITGLFGPSGAGKSTLLSCIAGLTTPHAGHIAVDGKTLFDSKSKTNILPHKRNIGFVFQDSRLLPNYSVEGNLKYGMPGGRRKSKDRLYQVSDILEISHLLKRSIRDLSGGEKQRIALGRAILSEPSLLLLDEPFSALDKKLTQKVISYISAVYELTEIPTLIVSHDIRTIMRLTESLVVVDNGKCIANGNIQELASKFDIMRIAVQQGYTFSKNSIAG